MELSVHSASLRAKTRVTVDCYLMRSLSFVTILGSRENLRNVYIIVSRLLVSTKEVSISNPTNLQDSLGDKNVCHRIILHDWSTEPGICSFHKTKAVNG